MNLFDSEIILMELKEVIALFLAKKKVKGKTR